MRFQGIAWHTVAFGQTEEVRLYSITVKPFFDQSVLFVALPAKEQYITASFVTNAHKMNPCVKKKRIYLSI
jgi:hypothetical protein